MSDLKDYVQAALALAMLMVVHECGHFFIARAFGMRVTKFSIGFGPTFFKVTPADGYFWFTTAADRVRLRLWRHDPVKHGPTVYQVAMIPFLAYVQIAGMNPLEDIEPTDKGSYANASLLGRILTILGGPVANYLFASVLFFAAFFIGGRELHTTVVTVVENRAAAAATMKTGDRVVEIDGVAVKEWEGMAEIISAHPNQALDVVVERADQRLHLAVTPKLDHGRGMIGVKSGEATRKVPVSAKEAAVMAIKQPPMVVKGLIIGLSEWVTNKADGQLSGPLGIGKEMAKAAHSGWIDLALLAAALSAYLGGFNLLPIPALDGGRLMFLGYEATTRRRPNAKTEMVIHSVGMAMMLCLMVWVTFNDLRSKPQPGDPAAAPSSSATSPAASAAPTAAPAAPATNAPAAPDPAPSGGK